MSNLQVDSYSFHPPPPPNERALIRRSVRSSGRSSWRALPTSVAPEIAFLAAQGIHYEALRYASELARHHGASADEVLIAEGLIREQAFYRALAAHLGAAFLDDSTALIPQQSSAEWEGVAALAENSCGLRWAVAPRGAGIARLIEAARNAEGPPLFAVTAPSLILAALDAQATSSQRAWEAAYRAEIVNPQICARLSSRRSVLLGAVAANALFFSGLFCESAAVSLASATFYGAAFLGAVCLRLLACAASFDAEEDSAPLDEARLPRYAIVFPLYDEAVVVPQLAQAINRLDYPRAKMDVTFVLEADDAETALALRDHAPRVPHRVVIAPHGAPKTKPRALNAAAPYLRGDLVAIFDAEDIPDPDQLKKAAAAFAHAPEDVACVQASLSIGNADGNSIAALYALDYAALFDVFNKGVAALGLPLFLGGTSNHFRGIR
jgi:hypothetical protein